MNSNIAFGYSRASKHSCDDVSLIIMPVTSECTRIHFNWTSDGGGCGDGASKRCSYQHNGGRGGAWSARKRDDGR